MFYLSRLVSRQWGVRSLAVEVSPPKRDLTLNAYTLQCPPEAAGPAAIGFSTTGSQPVHVRTGCKSRDQPPLCIQVAGPLPLRWGIFTGISRECSQQQAVDARSAATAADRRSPSPVPTPPSHRQVGGRSHLHHGQATQSPWSGAVAESDSPWTDSRGRLNYERGHPEDVIHIDVIKIAHLRKFGHRITSNHLQVRFSGVGYGRR